MWVERAAFGLSNIVMFIGDEGIGEVPVKLLFCGSAVLQLSRLRMIGVIGAITITHTAAPKTKLHSRRLPIEYRVVVALPPAG